MIKSKPNPIIKQKPNPIIKQKPNPIINQKTKPKLDLTKSKPLNNNSITYAYLIVSYILIYFILIPIINRSGISDRSIDIFKSYHIENKFGSLITNFFIHTMILRLAEKFPYHIPILFRRLLVAIVYNVLIGIYVNKSSYATNGTNTIKYLKEWSNSAGWIALIWEVIYVSLVGKAADYIDEFKVINKEPYKTILFGLVTVGMLHL
jgi:hypothetical protein